MLRTFLALGTLTLAALGGKVEEGVGIYKPVQLYGKVRESVEREKRELLQIEEISIGSGPLAAWGRRIKADIEVRYADGSLVYKGPVLAWVGFVGTVSIHNSRREDWLLPLHQRGISLGLNGMAVGGKRRIIVDPKLVCSHIRGGANPKAYCGLTGEARQGGKQFRVRKERLTVEATLTESFIPRIYRALYWNGDYAIQKIVGCRALDYPKRDPKLPIWHLY